LGEVGDYDDGYDHVDCHGYASQRRRNLGDGRRLKTKLDCRACGLAKTTKNIVFARRGTKQSRICSITIISTTYCRCTFIDQTLDCHACGLAMTMVATTTKLGRRTTTKNGTGLLRALAKTTKNIVFARNEAIQDMFDNNYIHHLLQMYLHGPNPGLPRLWARNDDGCDDDG